ncbi:MAG: hypothetical protein K1X94_09465 [Sandaracinaceae bacterium]|nr:hypothetical protein [Sandaracinaceae bacterium]
MLLRRSYALVVLLALGLSACTQEPPVGVAEADLTAAERRVRLTQIRDAAAARGLTNGVLLAGIAQNETGLAHCWSEATWACQGPNSVDCGGGPVIAGAGDGPCADMQGGLGMFQFDAGTYADTLAREGDRILTIAGNVEAAIDFCIAMVVRSVYIDGVDTPEQALAWMNSVVVGGAGHMEWIQTVTHYYNGCTPTGCSVYDTRFMHYSDGLHTVYDEMGAEFWSGAMAPTCEAIPAEGRVIDDTDACVLLGGDLRYWRTATDAGYGGSLRWTNAIDATGPSNYAVWTLRFAEAGEHELVVHTASPYAESHMAPYRITHAGGGTDVAIDQAAAEEHSLGTFHFEAGTDYQVHLGDDSGKPVADMIGIVCDALEIVPVAPPMPDAAMTSSPDAGMGPAPDAYVPPGVDGGTWMRPNNSASCGCRVGARAAPWNALGVVGLALAVAARRRRRAVRQ